MCQSLSTAFERIVNVILFVLKSGLLLDMHIYLHGNDVAA